jgi:hypothetical protein
MPSFYYVFGRIILPAAEVCVAKLSPDLAARFLVFGLMLFTLG